MSDLIKLPPGEITRQDASALRKMLEHIANAGEEFRLAARIWADFSDDMRMKILARSPGYMRGVFERLDRLNAGTLLPVLVAAPTKAAEYLGRLPIAQQERFLAEKLPVVVTGDNGRAKTVRLDVSELALDQRQQVFEVKRKDHGGAVRVRSAAEQRAWLAEQEERRAERERTKPRTQRIERPGKWVAMKGKIFPEIEFAESGFTANDLRAMMRDLRS